MRSGSWNGAQGLPTYRYPVEESKPVHPTPIGPLAKKQADGFAIVGPANAF